MKIKARVMTQQLRALVVLPEDPSLIPRTHIYWLIVICNSSYRAYRALSWPPWVPDMQVVHRHTYKQNTHLFLKKNDRSWRVTNSLPDLFLTWN